MKDEKVFPYKPKLITTILIGLCFGLATFIFAFMAQNNDRGLIISGIITLSEKGATIFYWVLATCAFLFVLLSIVLLYDNINSQRVIILKENSIMLPSGRWKKGEIEVPYEAITSIQETSFNKQKYLYIYADGLKHTIINELLPNDQAYEEIMTKLGCRGNKCETIHVKGS